MSVTLTSKDRQKLTKVHPDLVKVVEEAARITTIPFTILESSRTVEQQKKNIANGVSWTMRSRHIIEHSGYCHAVDLVPIDSRRQVIWAWPVYYKLAPVLKQAAANVHVPVEWGGDWKKNKDGPHWQLPWKQYP